jgi:aspartyl-tRNA(Asn)/glutamyl-tRNA(Gln) amidotransferase subunit A
MVSPMENNCKLTIAGIAPLIRRKKLSPVELTKFFLERIEQLQPAINAYITVTPERALTQAKLAEKQITKGHYRGVLHGIPISLKDLFYTRGVRTTAGSRVLRNFVPAGNAAVVDRLLDSGCILLGKTNMHEFAYGATNLNPHYGPVRNPWDLSRMSGGSSGGSAASVVSAQALASIGTDTGGSIRIPSAACGCVGFKPSYGRIPLDGVIPLSTTLDHAGPLSRCVLDAALLFDAVAQAGFWNSNPSQAVGRLRKDVKALQIGVPRQYFFDRIQPDVREAVFESVEVFRRLGARIREVNLQGMDETAQLAADITGAEALAFHERGLEESAEDYGEDVRSRLEQSRTMTATAYIKSLHRRLAYSREFERVLGSVHLLAVPTLPVTAPRLDQPEVKIGRPGEDVRPALLSLTRPGNLTGLPAMSLPCGFSSDHLPIGLQLIGRRFEEATVLRAAYAYECATPWHQYFPEQEPA